MSYFNEALRIVLQNEGGYTNHPADKGGETYRGIARNFTQSWQGWPIIDSIKRTRTIKSGEIINNEVLHHLVRQFYYTEKWLSKDLEKLTSQAVASLAFDMSTQHGNWARVINIALSPLGFNNNTDWFNSRIPNKLTSQSITLMNSKPQDSYNKIAQARKQYVQMLLDTGRLSRVFADGIFNRINRFINNNYKFVFAGTASLLLLVAGFFF
jgi:hypothetical protein